MIYNILQYAFAGLGALSIALGAWQRSKRGVFVMSAIASFCAAIAAHYHVFWATATFGLSVPWAFFCALPTIDLSWRIKSGFVLFLALGSWLSIYPTYADERYGRIDRSGLGPEERAKVEEDARVGNRGVREWLLSNIEFRLVRGLDLKGGLRLVYTVDVDEAIKDKRDRYYDEVRQALARSYGIVGAEQQASVDDLKKLIGKVRVEKSREHAGTLFINFENAADADKVNDEFMRPFQEMQRQFSSDRKRVTLRIKGEIESQIREKAVAQAKETVLRRVDSMGLKEAGVTTRDEDIIIEIPGDNDQTFAEIREIVSQTARLEFKLLDDEVNFFETEVRNPKNKEVKGLRFQQEQVSVGPGKQKVNTYAVLEHMEGEDMRQALARLREWTSTLSVPDDHEIGFGKYQSYDEEKGTVEDVGWRTYYLFSKAEITGDMVSDAQAMPDPSDRGLGGWLVQMKMTSVGGDRFEDITAKNIKRRFAIILDEKVESAPVIQTKIPGGVATITMGSANVDQQITDARKLELVLRSGALPAPISPSNEQRIGPSLGQDAIVQGAKGGLAGVILVLLFMQVYYSRAGAIANIAVLFNMVLQVAILAMFGASMTLPGIAGLVLTVGIAVDANVLINERIREELRQGKSPRAAVDVGYDKAFSAILDGHVTTLISGLILAQYGSGPIKGFAVTLIVGIAVSLFTGVVCTRLMFDWAVRARKVKKLHLG
ncbi:protein translocase subunit SecD [Polyangium jinanense]|uniref:Protein translocase subunit SecD n=1 Tax=Polyangium jinanense TaxID=2829994 RepID=A0A9X4AUM7_9BACT|nr:protein translocase subunit SecD [Polyangium jinanense]MDC3958245.1 protein translocase subunit SecD [Polyangium jinanense]MDC3983420.1 protein translocase subunit SecD [Polyangium jinanense]